MAQQSVAEFVDALAARTPTPGGGAAAALSAEMGVSLMLMVVRFARGKPGNADADGELAKAEAVLLNQGERIRPMADRDQAAFEQVMSAYRLPKGTAEADVIRQRAVEEAMLGAIVVPEELICLIRDVLAGAQTFAPRIGKQLISDLGAAVGLMRGAAGAAYLNVRINASYLKNRELADAALDRVTAVNDEIRELGGRLLGRVDAVLSGE